MWCKPFISEKEKNFEPTEKISEKKKNYIRVCMVNFIYSMLYIYSYLYYIVIFIYSVYYF